MSNWEETSGREYRAAHKREHYDVINLSFRKDAADGLTRDRVQQAAAERGMNASEYIKWLIEKDINGDAQH